MPHTLSDSDTSLLLDYLLRHPADLALVPIIHSLHSSLVKSRTASPYSTTDSGEFLPYDDFLGSGELESPEDFAACQWDTSSRLDLLDDRYSVDDANFESAISNYISGCNYNYSEPATTSSPNDYGISPSLIFKDKNHEVRNTVNIIVFVS